MRVSVIWKPWVLVDDLQPVRADIFIPVQHIFVSTNIENHRSMPEELLRGVISDTVEQIKLDLREGFSDEFFKALETFLLFQYRLP